MATHRPLALDTKVRVRLKFSGSISSKDQVLKGKWTSLKIDFTVDA